MIGLILAQRNDGEYLTRCLEPWITWRKDNPLLISCLDVCFGENGSGGSTDGSFETLQRYKNANLIDFLQQPPDGLKEHDARNVALKWLLEKKCDTIISIGADEIFTSLDTRKIFKYIEKEEFVPIFRIHYKNYVGDEKHYVKGFNPQRIWRVNYNGYKLQKFFWDDDILYLNEKGEEVIDRNLPQKTVPNVFVKHLTWLSNERSRNKIIYQNRHFVTGCGYKWNDENKSVEINNDFYIKTHQHPPEIHEEIEYHTGPWGHFVLDPLDGVCKTIKENIFWDRWLLPYFDEIDKNAIAIDIGASIGFHTVYLANKCKHVYSFEPLNINYKRLVKNVELNGLSNVTAYNCALYNKEMRMAVDNQLNQNGVDYNSKQACSLTLYENSNGDIEAKTLDSFNIENVSFIKIDAEGCDLDIMMGGIETINKYRPTIIFEYQRIPGVHNRRLGEYEDFIKEINYSMTEIIGGNYIAKPK